MICRFSSWHTKAWNLARSGTHHSVFEASQTLIVEVSHSFDSTEWSRIASIFLATLTLKFLIFEQQPFFSTIVSSSIFLKSWRLGLLINVTARNQRILAALRGRTSFTHSISISVVSLSFSLSLSKLSHMSRLNVNRIGFACVCSKNR